MKIDTNILMRFINNDLPPNKMEEIKILVQKNSQIKSRLEEIKNFKKTFKKGFERIKNTKIPDHLEEQISTPKYHLNKEKKTKKTLPKFYKIAASIIIIFTFGSIITLPNKAYLSQNPLSKIKKNNQVHFFYKEEKLDDFLSKNSNCSKPEEFTDEENKKVFAVSCKKNY